MGTLIPQTKYDVLEPGTYRVRLGAVAVEDGIYGTQVVMRFDVLDEEYAGRCIKAWAAAKLSGGRRPSKLYSWTSALLFAGKPLPDDYDLDTDALRNREALALVEVVERDGVSYNRVVQLFPLHGRGRGEMETRRRGDGAAASPGRDGFLDYSPNPLIPAESETTDLQDEGEWVDDPEDDGVLEDEAPW
jgi:hypothetical protein